jgi:hypothetical protein
MRLAPQTCCFFAGRVGALWPSAVAWCLTWSDRAWTPIVLDHLAIAEPKVWGLGGIRLRRRAVSSELVALDIPGSSEDAGGLLLRIRRSKADQEAEGETRGTPTDRIPRPVRCGRGELG